MSVAVQEHPVVKQVEKRLFIGGEWRDAVGGGTFAVEDPASGEPICEIADATPDDAKAALDAAVAAQPELGRHLAQRAQRDPRRDPSSSCASAATTSQP